MIKNVPVGEFPTGISLLYNFGFDVFRWYSFSLRSHFFTMIWFVTCDSIMITETDSMDGSLFGHDTTNTTIDPFAFTDTIICQDSIYSYCRWYNYRDWFSYKLWYYFYSLILWGVTIPFLFYGSFVCYATILIIDSVGFIDTIMANGSFAYLIQYTCEI